MRGQFAIAPARGFTHENLASRSINLEAAVVARPDDELGKVPVACVVPAAGRSITPQQVIGLYQNRLAAYKHPRDVLVLDELPRNATDKVDRKRLREIAASAAPHRTRARAC